MVFVEQFHFVIIRPQPRNLWDELFPINSEFYPTSGINMQNICWNMQFLSQLLMKCNIINNKA